MTEILMKNGVHEICVDGKTCGCIIPCEGATDTFLTLENGAWKWIRKCETPVTQMKMTVEQANPVTYWQVPSVNYNGNGWGSGAQYSGYRCGDIMSEGMTKVGCKEMGRLIREAK